MRIQGPYLLFENQQPSQWCYFDLSNPGQIDYFITPNAFENAVSTWEKVDLLPKTRLYTYDPEGKKFVCFFVQENQLLRGNVTTMGEQQVIRVVEQARIVNESIAWTPLQKKPMEFNVGLEKHTPDITMINTPLFYQMPQHRHLGKQSPRLIYSRFKYKLVSSLKKNQIFQLVYNRPQCKYGKKINSGIL